MGFFSGCDEGVHRFEPRYDHYPPEGKLGSMEGSEYAITSIIETLTKKVYIKDVCCRCGKEIAR